MSLLFSGNIVHIESDLVLELTIQEHYPGHRTGRSRHCRQSQPNSFRVAGLLRFCKYRISDNLQRGGRWDEAEPDRSDRPLHRLDMRTRLLARLWYRNSNVHKNNFAEETISHSICFWGSNFPKLQDLKELFVTSFGIGAVCS